MPPIGSYRFFQNLVVLQPRSYSPIYPFLYSTHIAFMPCGCLVMFPNAQWFWKEFLLSILTSFGKWILRPFKSPIKIYPYRINTLFEMGAEHCYLNFKGNLKSLCLKEWMCDHGRPLFTNIPDKTLHFL